MRPRALSWQSYALAALCAADLVSTVWLCSAHGAAEANPIMAYFLAQGVIVFAVAKLLFTALPLTILEWARRIRPKLGVIALNTALLGYMTLYGAGLAHINGGPPLEQALAKVDQDPRRDAVWAEIQRRIEDKRSAAAWTPSSESGLCTQAPGPGAGKALLKAGHVDGVEPVLPQACEN